MRIWTKYTHPKYLDRAIDITQPLNGIHVTTYVVQRIDEGSRETNLFSYVRNYQEDFDGWTKYQFDSVHRAFQKVLVKQL